MIPPTGARIPAALCGALALWCGCGPEPVDDGRPPNVVLVSIDTLRWDALGSYGGPIATPAFDRLARDGTIFEVALAPAPETAPSHATLLTGKSVLRHGVTKNGVSLGSEHPTLASVFRAAGYRTAAFVSSFVLDPRFGWQRGFDHYDASFPEEGATLRKAHSYPGAFWTAHRFEGFDRRAVATTRALEEWLATATEPFFLFVHYFDPHLPYVPPRSHLPRRDGSEFDLADRHVPGIQPVTLRELVRRYHGEVAYADAQLGRLLEAIRAKGRGHTLLAVTSDHGEGLGQHGWIEHGVFLYDEQIRVPLLFHWPGRIAPGARVATPVGLADVAPTLAELAGVPFPGARAGRSLTQSVRSGAEPEPRPILGHRRLYEKPFRGHRGEKFSVRTRRWKYIRASEGPEELYDLVADPGELIDVRARHPAVVAQLRAVLDADLRAAGAREPAPPLSDETRRGLEALGYVE